MVPELITTSLDKKVEEEVSLTMELIGKNSKSIYQKKEHALIGVSPFNSYFTEENLIKLISWALNNFNNITIFLPDKISVFTLMALGYSIEKAEHKVKRQDRYLKNKVFRALHALGLNEPYAQKIFITFTDLSQNIRYQEIYKKCLTRFENDIHFKEGCLSTSSWILTNHLKLAQLSSKKIELAVNYFLKELPLFLDTPSILNVESSLFIYHVIPKYLQDLYNNSILVSSTQGCLRVST